MITKFVRWLAGQSQVERLLLAATVVAGLRMMLIHAVFIGFDLSVWPWFSPLEVLSGLAFAVLEGKALAYVSRLWVKLRPERWEDWLYWSVLAIGQFLLLASIVVVTAYAASSVRQGVPIDDLLGPGAAVAWSMFVVALNPLMVILIGIARAVDPAEQPEPGPGRAQAIWPPLETQVKLFLADYDGPALDPPGLVAAFERVSGHRLTLEEAEAALVGDVHAGELTPEQRRGEVARLLGQDVSQAEMARRLNVSYATIKRDVAAVRNGK